MRLRRRNFSAAATDYAHVLDMLGQLHGPNAREIIEPADALCKACVMLERWTDAAEAMSRAHALSCVHVGERHAESRRRAEVLRTLREREIPAA